MESKLLFSSKILLVVALPVIAGCARTTTVTGKLLDVNGKPSEYAMVGIASSIWDKGDNFVPCRGDGLYSISLEKQRIEYLIYSIPNHEPLRIPVLNDQYKELAIDVTLAAYNYPDHFDEVSVKIGGSYLSPKEKMTKLEDGTYACEKKTDKDHVLYQLDVHEGGRFVNGPEAQSFVPDSLGGYWSVIEPQGGKTTIVFDPETLLRRDDSEKIAFYGSDFDKKFSTILREHDNIMRDNGLKLGAYYLKQGKFEGFVYDEGNYFRDFVKSIETEKDTRLSNLMKLIYLTSLRGTFKTLDMAKAKEFFNAVPPEDSAWCYFPTAFYSVDRLYPLQNPQWAIYDEFQQKTHWAFHDEFLKKTKSPEIKITVLGRRLIIAKNSNNVEEFKRLHALISSDYKDVKELQDLLRKYPIESKLNVGGEIPDYEVVSIDNPSEKYSKRSMLGKVYLIDFWFTTCAPCIEEAGNLHKAYEKYKDKGFDILSLSVDSEELVKLFRERKWKMPWKNSVIVGNKQILKDFEVSSYPTPILVSAEGKVLVKDAKELRGERLDETLLRFLQ